MKFQVGQHAEDLDKEFDQCGFRHHSWDRFGVEKFLDNVGNAIFVNRDSLIVNIYSKDTGKKVDELNLPPVLGEWERRWPRMAYAERKKEEHDESERRSKLQQAWDDLLNSLPSPDEISTEGRNAVLDARWPLEYALVDLGDYYDDEDESNPLTDA